jgi:hypothetical protein
VQPAPLQDRLYQARMHLLIDKDQGPAWERFYSAEMALQQGPGPGAPDPSMTAPQAMQLARTAAENRYARTEELAEALKVLYLQLDDNQRRAADEVLPPLLMQYAAGPRAPRGAAER